LQAQHCADKQAASHDDHQRQRAGIVHLIDDQRRPQQRARRLHQDAAQEHGDAADRRGKIARAVRQLSQ
jgi:hypothetical protein